MVEDTGEDSQRALFLEASSSGPSGPGASRASFEPLKKAWMESWERSSRGSRKAREKLEAWQERPKGQAAGGEVSGGHKKIIQKS